jgi:hypothetical protein
MNDATTDMYGDEEDVPQTSPSTNIQLVEKGMIKEITIDGKKISVVDASAMVSLENMLKKVQDNASRMENDLRTALSRISMLERRIINLTSEMDNKVSYE